MEIMEDKNLIIKLEKSLSKLNQFLKADKSEMQMLASVKSFDWTYELSLKLIDSVISLKPCITNGYRDSIRIAGRIELIDDVEDWLIYSNKRNRTIYVYNEKILKEIYSYLNPFSNSVRKLIDNSVNYIK